MSHVNEKGGRRPPRKACSGLKLSPHKQLTNFQLILWSIPEPWLEHTVPLSYPPCKKGARWNTDWARARVRDFHSMDITEPHLSLKSQRWRAGWEDTWREKGCVYVWKGCDAAVVKMVVCVCMFVCMAVCSVTSRVLCQWSAWCGVCDVVWALRGTDTVVVTVVCAYECVGV